jgi:hypothetical protein
MQFAPLLLEALDDAIPLLEALLPPAPNTHETQPEGGAAPKPSQQSLKSLIPRSPEQPTPTPTITAPDTTPRERGSTWFERRLRMLDNNLANIIYSPLPVAAYSI